MDSLPPLLAVDVTQAQDEWLDSTIKLLKGARQAPEAVAQVAEMAFRHAVQSHVAGLRGGDGGWLSGLNDPNVAKALSVIHARFAEDLDLEELAREAALSRSALGERFVELLGEPPMRYCARWRMRVAANMLRAGKESSSTCLRCRLQQRGGVQPRVQARVCGSTCHLEAPGRRPAGSSAEARAGR